MSNNFSLNQSLRTLLFTEVLATYQEILKQTLASEWENSKYENAVATTGKYISYPVNSLEYTISDSYNISDAMSTSVTSNYTYVANQDTGLKIIPNSKTTTIFQSNYNISSNTQSVARVDKSNSVVNSDAGLKIIPNHQLNTTIFQSNYDISGNTQSVERIDKSNSVANPDVGIVSLPDITPSLDSIVLTEGISLATDIVVANALTTLDLAKTFFLSSLSGANQTIYLDFDGNTTSGTIWNTSFTRGANIVTSAFDFDGNKTSFSSAELERIQYIWQRVAEDFSPFNVNVTTQAPTDVNDLIKSSSTDTRWGVRVVIGGSSYDWFQQGAGGVAYINSFNWNSDTPAFVFDDQLANGSEKPVADAITHEVGHTLGLTHDGQISPANDYYSGHGSGDTGWAPIMGVGYGQNLVQWSKGEYTSANNTQDDLQIITTKNGFSYRTDDAGNTIATAKLLTISGNSFSGSGIIERNTDVDFYRFTTVTGALNLTVNPFSRGPNLDILAELYNSTGNLIASSNPTDLLSANIATNVTEGAYYLKIDGVGKGNPLTTGYTDYGSLGQYFISGSTNTTPTNLVISNSNITENQVVGTVIGNFTTTDPDAGSTFTYGLVAGTGATDNALFTIAGNQLKSNAVFNFETKSSYSVRVRSTDQGGLSFEKQLTIGVTNVNETPTNLVISNSNIAENQVVGTVIGNFTTTDPDAGSTFTYGLVAGTGATDNALFTIAGNQLKSNAGFDFETKSSYSVRVRSTDQGGLSFEKQFTIGVTNVNETPTNLVISNSNIAENQVVGTVIGNFTTTDPDAGSTFTYGLVAGTGSADNALFTIAGNQLKSNAGFDFETKSSYSVRVRSTDQGGLSFEKQFTIGVTNVNETPTNLVISNSNIAENQVVGTVIGNFTTTDPDAGSTFTYGLVAGTGSADNALFTIAGNQLKSNAGFDFETKSSYSVRVRGTDQGGLSFEKQLTIGVTNVNETPTNLVISNSNIAENQVVGTVIGNFTTTDPDAGNTFTYGLVAGTGSADNALFTIAGNQLKSNAGFDFETKSSYSVRVRSTDQGGLSFEKQLTIGVTNVNETPTNLVISNSNIAENQVVGTVIGNFTTTDPDAGSTFTYGLVAGTGSADNALFTIAGNQLKSNAGFDFETKSSYSVRVRSTDQGGLSFEKQFTIGVTNVNETPTNLVISNSNIAENQVVGTVIGNFTTTDPDAGSTFTYGLVAGTGATDNALFTIAGNQLKSNAGFDFETKSSYSVRVRSTDQGGLSFEKQLTIGISNLDNNIVGTVNNENFTTTSEKDIIDAAGGNDTVNSVFANLQQSDTLNGNTGTDTLVITGGTTANSLTINASNTTNQIGNISGTTVLGFERFDLSGFAGTVNFTGTIGDDWMKSGAGADTLSGGVGNDSLYLGLNDRVVDNVKYAAGDGTDTIYEFVRGVGGDKLNFTGIAKLDVVKLGTDTQLRVGDGIVGNTGFGTGQLLVTLSATSGFTSADVNVNLFGASFLFN